MNFRQNLYPLVSLNVVRPCGILTKGKASLGMAFPYDGGKMWHKNILHEEQGKANICNCRLLLQSIMICLKIFETGQTRLWETQKSKRVEIVSFEVETKKETGINHQVFRNCAAVLPGFPKPNYLLKVCRAIDFSKLKRNSSWFQYYQ